jgi:hypothetical protein
MNSSQRRSQPVAALALTGTVAAAGAGALAGTATRERGRRAVPLPTVGAL